MKEELKPCPYCGSTKIMAEGQVNWVAMVCQRCQAQGPKQFQNSEVFGTIVAGNRWNKRKETNAHRTKAHRPIPNP